MEMHNPFVELSTKLEAIQREQKELKELLKLSVAGKEPRDLLTVQMASELLGLSPATLYSKSNRGEIPSKRQGGRLYFSKKEILQWLDEGANSRFSLNHLSNVKTPVGETEAIHPWKSEEFKKAWQAWKKHLLTVHSFNYRSIGEEQRQLNRLDSKANGELEIALELIQESIDAGKLKI